jgi:hypothetical protein
MTNDEWLSISITLSPAQIDEVVRAATQSRAPSVSTLITNALRAPLQPQRPDDHPERASPPSHGHDGLATDPNVSAPGGYLSVDTVDPRLSRSLLRGLSLLTCFGPDGAARGIVEMASDLGMSPSTAHRYAFTLVELGLLERCPKTRKYRLPGT